MGDGGVFTFTDFGGTFIFFTVGNTVPSLQTYVHMHLIASLQGSHLMPGILSEGGVIQRLQRGLTNQKIFSQ